MYLGYKNQFTLDFLSWCSRHENIPNRIGKAYAVLNQLPQIAESIRSYQTGVHDIRAAVVKHYPVIPGNYASFMKRQEALDILVVVWRQYQSYLRSRECERDAGRQQEIRREVLAYAAARERIAALTPEQRNAEYKAAGFDYLVD